MKPLATAALAAGLALLAPPLQAQSHPRRAGSTSFTVVEATIPDMRKALEEGRVTSRELVRQYLRRIALYEKRLNAVMAVNPRALEEADRLDHERAQGRIRGPLHGIPIALKDNIQTSDLATTGGALAFAELVPPYDATLTRNLRDAGAIILAKTTLTELANYVAEGMPGNYSALGGFGMNPYDPRPDPRPGGDGRPVLNTGGSSSGSGTAASFWAGNIGTETSGSILSPSSATMLAGIKPTVGRISRWGVIPITADQDTPGPMARTVTDAAILLGAAESASPDPEDPATRACTPPPNRDYTRFLKTDALHGARIGIPRAYFYDTISPPRGVARGGLSAAQRAAMNEAIAVLRARGAIVVDPADIPSVVTRDASRNYLLWNDCRGLDDRPGHDADCSLVFGYGMKRDFNRWLKTLGTAAPVNSLTELRAWNVEHQRMGAIEYGQAELDRSDRIDLERDRARYEADRAKDEALAGAEGIDAALREHRLDALLFPGSSGARISAKPGYPTVIVPFALVPNARADQLPAGFDAKPGPFGVSFAGTACSEPRLIALAYAFEQATRRRVPPPDLR